MPVPHRFDYCARGSLELFHGTERSTTYPFDGLDIPEGQQRWNR